MRPGVLAMSNAQSSQVLDFSFKRLSDSLSHNGQWKRLLFIEAQKEETGKS
jgi:hypothetical protein